MSCRIQRNQQIPCLILDLRLDVFRTLKMSIDDVDNIGICQTILQRALHGNDATRNSGNRSGQGNLALARKHHDVTQQSTNINIGNVG